MPGQDTVLTSPLVPVDATMPRLLASAPAALTACCSCGAAYAATSSGGEPLSSHLRPAGKSATLRRPACAGGSWCSVR
jgi:hypothetical protein